MKPRRSRWRESWWAWGAAAFLLHAALVAILLRIRGSPGWSDRSGAAGTAKAVLGTIDFWVYQWIWQPLNTERFGRPFLEAAALLRIRSMDTLLFAWEFLILAVFGGLVYAVIAVAVWLKRRAHAQAAAARWAA